MGTCFSVDDLAGAAPTVAQAASAGAVWARSVVARAALATWMTMLSRAWGRCSSPGRLR
jgi:hypothetical protein